MPEALKERSQIEEQYKWDLTRMFADDAAWEKALGEIDADIDAMAAYAGKLKDAATIRAWFDAATELSRKLDNLFCYSSAPQRGYPRRGRPADVCPCHGQVCPCR